MTVQKYTNFSICVRFLKNLLHFDLILFDIILILFVFCINLFGKKRGSKDTCPYYLEMSVQAIKGAIEDRFDLCVGKG